MKFTINQKVLEKALAHANWIIERKNAVPILGYVLFEADKQKGLTITATNMDMSIVDSIDCEILQNGKYCLPAGLLYDITKKIRSSSDITLAHSEATNTITLTSGKASFEIHYMEGSQFPPITSATYDVHISMNTKILKNAINVAKVAMLQDNTRFHLNGIHMHYENEMGIDKIRFVATDLFRIACVSVAAPSEAQHLPPIIISKRTVAEVLKLIDSGSDENAEISVSENRISFKVKGSENISTEFSSRLISGTFPEYKAALDVSNNKILVVNTADFIESLDRVSTVVMDSTSSVRLHITQDMLSMSGVSREFGSATDELDATFNVPEPLDICFNSKFLLEILKEIETPQVKLLLAESNSSTIVRPIESDEKPEVEMVFAVMPIEIVQS